MWFYFAVQGAQSGQKVLFNVVGYSKTKSLYRDGMAPVVCTSGRPHWERMPEGSVYFYRSPRHGRQYVLSFPFCFERANEVYYFAYCFPYTYSYLQRFLHSLDNAQLTCCRMCYLVITPAAAPQHVCVCSRLPHVYRARSYTCHRWRSSSDSKAAPDLSCV